MEPINYYNRYTQKIEQESVYGLAWLKWSYGNPLGRLSLHALVKRAFFSRWYGRRMDSPSSRAKIVPFLQKYGTDISELADPVDSYQTFNEFFYRQLKPSARPISSDSNSVCFPADGRHLAFQDISEAPGFFIKGQRFDLRKLLGDSGLAEKYKHGTAILSRLCPVDYHRYHFPVGGQVTRSTLINGPLYSVNPIALRQNLNILAENKRAWCRIESPVLGSVLMFEIGATCVGSFEYTYQPDSWVEKGTEKGYFKFGGSSTFTLFPPNTIQLDSDLIEHSSQQRELYARMGDRMGRSLR